MYAPDTPEIPIAKQAPRPAVTIISVCVTCMTHEPTIIPNMVMEPSKPFFTKYLRAIGPISVIWIYNFMRLIKSLKRLIKLDHNKKCSEKFASNSKLQIVMPFNGSFFLVLYHVWLILMNLFLLV